MIDLYEGVLTEFAEAQIKGRTRDRVHFDDWQSLHLVPEGNRAEDKVTAKQTRKWETKFFKARHKKERAKWEQWIANLAKASP